eukprot:6200103-Amphidinium_carterae.1
MGKKRVLVFFGSCGGFPRTELSQVQLAVASARGGAMPSVFSLKSWSARVCMHGSMDLKLDTS